MRNNISHFQEGKQPLQYLSINLYPSEQDLCYWHRVNGKIPPRILPFHELMSLTFCAYELVANSSKKLLYNTRPYLLVLWYYCPAEPWYCTTSSTAWRDCSAFPILYCLLYTPALFWLYEALYVLVDAFCDLKVRLAITEEGGGNKSCAAMYQYRYNCVGHNFQQIGWTAPLVAAFVKAFTAAKQAASNDHEGTATSSQQKVGGPSLVDRVLYKGFRKGAVSPVHARQQPQQ